MYNLEKLFSMAWLHVSEKVACALSLESSQYRKPAYAYHVFL